VGKSLYLVALLATIALFAVIFFTVKSFEDSRFSNLNDSLREIDFENNLARVYSEFKISDANNYCFFTNESITNTTMQLEDLDYRLTNYRDSLLSTDYVFVKRNFLLANMLLFAQVDSAIKECDLNVKPILYFYAEDKSCDVECGTILGQLDHLKSLHPEIRVFAFPYNWPDYKFTSLLEHEYDVNKAGTLVINGKKFDSLQSDAVLSKALGYE